jgi:hypothetical protein
MSRLARRVRSHDTYALCSRAGQSRRSFRGEFSFYIARARELTHQGGYNLSAISNSAFAVAQVLLGETPPELGALKASEVATEVVHQVAKVHSKYWKSIDPVGCEPPEGEPDPMLQ